MVMITNNVGNDVSDGVGSGGGVDDIHSGGDDDSEWW